MTFSGNTYEEISFCRGLVLGVGHRDHQTFSGIFFQHGFGQSICLAQDLSHSLFASRSLYAALVSSVRYGIPKPDSLKLLTGWRKKFAGARLREMPAGERSIKVADKSGLELD